MNDVIILRSNAVMNLVLGMKEQAECSTEVTSNAMYFSESVESLMSEIDEINESQVVVELAQIEAMKELAEIEAMRDQEFRNFSTKMDEKIKKYEVAREEIGDVEELESQLFITLSDMNFLLNQLEDVQKNKIKDEDSDIRFANELQKARQELASVREEELHLNTVIENLKTEKQLKISVDEAEVAIGELKSKLIEAKKALRILILAEENGASFISNMSSALDQLNKQTEAKNKEKMLTEMVTAMTEEEIQKIEDETDLTDEFMASAVQELEAVKSMETRALERLQEITESVMEIRDVESLSKSTVTLSVFEYDYLITSAKAAQEVADYKVAAAKALVRALNLSREEMVMNMEKAQNGYGKTGRKKSDSLCRAIIPLN